MTSSYSTRNRLTKQGTGDNADTWGDILNQGVFDLTDDALDGVSSVNVTGSVTIDFTTSLATGSTDQARMRVLKFLGIPTPTQTSVTLPALEKWYWVYTSLQTNSNIVLHAAGSLTEVTIGPNSYGAIWCDGTDLFKISGEDADPSLFFQVANRFSEISADTSAQGVARDNLGLEGGATTSIGLNPGYLVQFTSVNGNPALPASDGSLLYEATETKRGVVRYATLAEGLAGVAASTAITPAVGNAMVSSGINSAITASVVGDQGILVFPGSIAFQWGVAPAVPYNTPTTVLFPNAFTSVYTGMVVGWKKTLGYDRDTAIDNISNTQIVVRHGAGTAHDVAWQVWGKL